MAADGAIANVVGNHNHLFRLMAVLKVDQEAQATGLMLAKLVTLALG